MDIVELAPRGVLAEARQRVDYAYFPHSAVVSFMATMQDRGVAETATVGREGFLGFQPLLGSPLATNRMLVQVPGYASRIAVRQLVAEFNDSPSLRSVLLQYIGLLLVQTMQSVACNGLHRIEGRYCRWLLTAHDGAGRDEFPITQEFLAELLSVHRPTVTIVARAMQHAGVIRYRRGVITIQDRKALEAAACECYAVVRRAFDKRFPGRRSRAR
ncbi:MAG: Crp/Fnr family transcriptional regulator [Stellaceae bacterium]